MFTNGLFPAPMQLPNCYIKSCGWIPIFALLLMQVPAWGQSQVQAITGHSITFEHINEEQGINNYVTCIFEDHLGYLWFGAGPEGLYRYDGYEFKHYEYLVDDTTSLPHNIVATIFHEDRSGNLWLASGGAIARYNRASDNFKRMSHLRQELGWFTWASLNSVAEDSDGNIWLSSYGNPAHPESGGLVMIDPDTEHVTQYKHNPTDSSSLSSNCISSLFADRDGILWIGHCGRGIDRFVPPSESLPGHFVHYRNCAEDPADSIRTPIREFVDDQAGSLWFRTDWNGILRYLKKEDCFKRYPLHPQPPNHKLRVTRLAVSPEGEVWMGTQQGLARYDRDMDEMKLYNHHPDNPRSISRGNITDIDFAKDGSIWMVMGDGHLENWMERFDPSSESFFVHKHRYNDPQSLSKSYLNSALVDRNGILWIATAAGGINKFDPNRRKFNSIFSNLTDAKQEYPDQILALCLDSRNVLWIGTDGDGLYSYERNSGKTTIYPYNTPESAALKSRKIHSIIESPEGILWIGGDSGLNRLDTRRMESEHFWPDPEKQNYYGPNYIRDLYRGSSGTIWIATMHGGLLSFNTETSTFTSHRQSEKNPGGVPVSGLMCVLEKDGKVWAGTLGGLFSYSPGDEEEASSHIRYSHDPSNPHSLSADMVGDLLFDKSGSLWIATGGGGLNKLDTASGEFIRYTTKEGILSNSITTLCLDGNGKLWLGSFSGLGLFDPLTESSIVYDRTDGLTSREIRQGSSIINPAGEIFFAGPDGINYFHPDSMITNDYIPPVVITRMQLFAKPLIPEANGRLELKHHENFLTLEFAALNYSNSPKNQYRYRMIGLDQDTIHAGTRRYASYTDMKPGSYTFWVSGSNNDGIWNPEGISLDILIHPPWSRSSLAFGIYVILILSVVLGIIRWRTWKLINDRKILEEQVKQRTQVIEEKDRHILEMDRMKTRFFANISHEFRTPLALIISPLEEIIARRKQGDPELKKLGVIQRNSQRLLSLVNQLLDLAKLDSGKLKLELVKSDVVSRMRLNCASFISMAEKNRIKYNYHLPDREYVTYFDLVKLDSILINLLSNAFKYTPREGIVDCYVRIEGPSNESPENKAPAQLSISVIDSGPGIDPEKQKHIFDRFYQGDEEHQTEGGGSGIGLSLTKELVELLHGKITVNSEPGEGSCFTVTIPLDKEHLKESEYLIKEEAREEKRPLLNVDHQAIFGKVSGDEISDEDALPSMEPIHLLIVEDNDDLRIYVKEQLQNAYTILEAANGVKGLKQALKHIPDLIITDVMMPGMDGMELCQRLKTNERTSHIPVIMLTAKADFESKISGLELGADDYILKPFQIRELRTRVDNLIRQRNTLRERFGGNLTTLSEDITLNSYDVKFIRRVSEVVEDHLADFEFDVKALQEKSGLSHTQLYRKLHALTGYSPSRFIRHFRLKRAVKLLEQNHGSVTQVAFEVGFGNLSYFTKCFKEQFGISPSAYTKQCN